jgi:hypothetical protein
MRPNTAARGRGVHFHTHLDGLSRHGAARTPPLGKGEVSAPLSVRLQQLWRERRRRDW